MCKWVKVYGYDVYIGDDNEVLSAIKIDHNGSPVTAYPYHKTGSNTWSIVVGCSITALRAGMKRGTYIIS